MSDNPYKQAVGTYTKIAAQNTSGRELEAAVLNKSAQMLEMLAARIKNGEQVPLEEIGDTLTHNRQIWQVFLDNMMDKDAAIPLEIKNNIANLAVYVFKRTQEILIDTNPDKFKVLVDINRNIAAGLSVKPPSSSTELQANVTPIKSAGIDTDI